MISLFRDADTEVYAVESMLLFVKDEAWGFSNGCVGSWKTRFPLFGEEHGAGL